MYSLLLGVVVLFINGQKLELIIVRTQSTDSISYHRLHIIYGQKSIFDMRLCFVRKRQQDASMKHQFTH